MARGGETAHLSRETSVLDVYSTGSFIRFATYFPFDRYTRAFVRRIRRCASRNLRDTHHPSPLSGGISRESDKNHPSSCARERESPKGIRAPTLSVFTHSIIGRLSFRRWRRHVTMLTTFFRYLGSLKNVARGIFSERPM